MIIKKVTRNGLSETLDVLMDLRIRWFEFTIQVKKG